MRHKPGLNSLDTGLASHDLRPWDSICKGWNNGPGATNVSRYVKVYRGYACLANTHSESSASLFRSKACFKFKLVEGSAP